jgi:hypothetical protein
MLTGNQIRSYSETANDFFGEKYWSKNPRFLEVRRKPAV